MKEALDLTWTTLEARLRNYRLAAFLVLAWATLLVVLLLVFRRPLALLWLLALPPIILAMVARDQKLVHRWEGKVLEIWKGGILPMDIFKHAITVQPDPLKSSRLAMAAALPADAGDGPPDPAAADRRIAEAAARHRLNRGRLARNAAVLALGAAGVAATCWFLRSP